MGKNQSLNLPYPITLASTSKYRARLLGQLGWPFETLSPGVDEDQLKLEGLSASKLAIELSRLKARAVFKLRPHHCVIGSDQVCHMEGTYFSKPVSVERAISQLQEMQGKAHQLLTAVTICTPESETSFLNTTVLHMRNMSLSEIQNYVQEDLPLDCAGSYKLESRGLKLFEKIQMDDHTAIIGLPLIELSNILIGLGYPL